MRKPQKVVERQWRRNVQKVCVEKTEVAKPIERPDLVVRLALRDDADGKVDRIAVELVKHRRVVQSPERQTDARRVVLQVREQTRSQQHLDAARHGNGKRALDGGGLEAVLAKDDRLELLECRTHRPDQRLGARRQCHALGRTGQDLVAEELAQATEGAAHRRLTDAEMTGGARDAALRQKRIERDEQVQIDAGKLMVVDRHRKESLVDLPGTRSARGVLSI